MEKKENENFKEEATKQEYLEEKQENLLEEETIKTEELMLQNLVEDEKIEGKPETQQEEMEKEIKQKEDLKEKEISEEIEHEKKEQEETIVNKQEELTSETEKEIKIEESSKNEKTENVPIENDTQKVVSLEKENMKHEIENTSKQKSEKSEKEENEKKEPAYTVVNNHEKGKRKLATIITVTIVVLAILFFSVIFSLGNMGNDKILKGVSILGIEVGDLPVEKAKEKLSDAIESRFQDENNTLILKRGETELSVTANTFNAKFDLDKAIAQAHNIGRDGNIVTNNYAILFTRLFKKQIEPELYLDEELLSSAIADANSKLVDKVVENSYYIEGKELVIVKGKAGYSIHQEELKNKIYAQLKNIHTNYQEIEIPTIYKEPDAINLEKIRREIYKEPQDAYVSKNPTTVHVHVDGVDFGISMEEAKKLIEEEKEEYKIPLKITTPKKTIKDLGEEAFPDTLSNFTTRYDAGSRNRATNIELAAKKINGTVIMPGEKFSYNTTVGRATLEAGFKEGTAYVGGKVVPDVGGGICQVSSTLYNAVLLANLEIGERNNHTFLTGYVAASRDATVYYGSLDFTFKNSRKYPVKVVASAKNGVCKVSIQGIKEEKEYEVVIQSKITSYINQTTKYVEDATLEEGKEIVEQYGSNGCRSEGYRILKLNGKVISQTLLSKDTYRPMERIIRRGTKKVGKPQQPDKPSTNTTTES